MPFVELAVGFAVILAGAELFTNAVEWLGKRLRLSQGAVGSILAAVGTALPETLIPIMAIVFGTSGTGQEIGVGAILGAPFMLSTLAFFITGVAGCVCFHGGRPRQTMLANQSIISRDLTFFIIVYATAIATAFLPDHPLKSLVSVFLLLAYAAYVRQTVRSGQALEGQGLHRLFFARFFRTQLLGAQRGHPGQPHPGLPARAKSDPALALVILQLVVALAAIIGGADLFVKAITDLAWRWGVPAFVLSVIIAPVATELPEKANSVIWVRQGKDTLALGNITGAMVFQSSVIPAVGIALTPWRLTDLALVSAVISLSSAATVLLAIRRRGHLRPPVLLVGGLYYSAFLALVLVSQTRNAANLGFIVLLGGMALAVERLYQSRLKRVGVQKGRLSPGPTD